MNIHRYIFPTTDPEGRCALSRLLSLDGGTAFGPCACGRGEGNESASDTEETECPSVRDQLVEGQAALGKGSECFQSEHWSAACRTGWLVDSPQVTQVIP